MSIKLFCTIKHFFALLNNRDAKVILTVFQKAPRSTGARHSEKLPENDAFSAIMR